MYTIEGLEFRKVFSRHGLEFRKMYNIHIGFRV